MQTFSKEFLRQQALESILYCYDRGGWKFAKKMADFWFKERANMYGGGYVRGMSKEEYHAFLESLRKKDIKKFIDFYLV